MRQLLLFFALLPCAAFAQYAGDYGTADTTAFQIIQRTDGYYLGTEHYGNIRMLPAGNGMFTLDRVRPVATITFDTATDGRVIRMYIRQPGKFTWIKEEASAAVEGSYRQDIDASLHILVHEEGGKLMADAVHLRALGRDRYLRDDTRVRDSAGPGTGRADGERDDTGRADGAREAAGRETTGRETTGRETTGREDTGREDTGRSDVTREARGPNDAGSNDVYTFERDRNGKVKRLVIQQASVQTFLRRGAGGPVAALRTHAPDRHLGFSRADTLEGAPLPARTCYDVLFYDLDVAVDPGDRSVRGSNRIRFRAVRDLDSLQLDLYGNLRVDSILFGGRPLTWRRELNAVYLRFSGTVGAGTIGEVDIFYAGKPVFPDPSVLQGGILWFHDANGKPWAESVCQGSGGSIWWPGKDLLSDKPDSMRITLTVPAGLTGVSNGRLVSKTILADGKGRFVWFVSHPIINYDVAFYIGDYMHWRDSGGYDYYCMPYSEEKARRLFAGVPAMMRLYEKDFGPYPFARDGFKLVEGLYPMEHQSAVSMGPITPLGGESYDSAETTRTMWHESAHEWWGNSVSCADFADLWLHEGFATYAEELAYDAFAKGDGRYRRHEEPANKEPIIGVADVNYFYLGDMYSKGSRLLLTLQHAVGDDSVWFGALRGIQERLRYGSVRTEDVVRCFNTLTGHDYTPVFEQYLRHTSLPVLQWKLVRPGVVQYRWKADVPGFAMPVRVNGGMRLEATDQWQEVRMEGVVKVDTGEYYVGVEELIDKRYK